MEYFFINILWFSFPITAYTKLSTGIDRLEIIIKGFTYLVNFSFADIAGAFLVLLHFRCLSFLIQKLI